MKVPEYIFHKPDQVEAIVEGMQDFRTEREHSVQAMTEMMTAAVGFITQGKHMDYQAFYYEMGCTTLGVMGRSFAMEPFCEMIINKHHDYGCESLLRWKGIGIVNRIDSKISRLTNLLKKGAKPQVKDESAGDTITDVLGYCVVGVFVERWLEIN